MRASLLSEVPAILNTLIQQAKTGDVGSAKVILDRVLPPLKAEARAVALPTADDPTTQAGVIVAAAVAGTVPTEQAVALMDLLFTHARLREMTELFRRIDALTAAVETIQKQRQAPAFGPSQTPF